MLTSVPVLRLPALREETVASPALEGSTALVTAVAEETTRLRAIKSAGERASRLRRQERLEQLRARVKLMEQVVVALPLMRDTDQIWDDFIDDYTKTARAVLRRFVPAIQAAQKLVNERTVLRTLLAEHEVMSRAVQAIIESETTTPWEWDVQRWKALARVHFRPWTEQQVMAELDVALHETHRFRFSTNKHTTGLNFMGWEDSLRLLQDGTMLQFSVHKTFTSHNLAEHVAFIARTHTETSLYHKVLLGARGRASVDVLQQITPTAAIVFFHEQYEGTEHAVHAISLVADVETEDGWVQYIRSIDAPEVLRAFQQPTDAWIKKDYWMQHDVLDPSQPSSSCDYRASLCGTLMGHNGHLLAYAKDEVSGTRGRSRMPQQSVAAALKACLSGAQVRLSRERLVDEDLHLMSGPGDTKVGVR